VSVLGAVRVSSSVRERVRLSILLIAVLSLPAFGFAQTAIATQVEDQPASEAQLPATTPSEQVSPPIPIAPGDSSQDAASSLPRPVTWDASQLATAGQIEDAASAEVPANPGSTTATTQNAQSPGAANPVGSLQAKYDVSQIGHRNIGSGLDFYSIDREIALGHQLASEVEQNTKLVTDPTINEYINRIGQNLVRNSDARVPFTIKVLDTDEVNAFALPGGFFFVNSGLILAADDEAELAGVMAHEIAHVAARHATKNMTRAQIWNMASVPLIFIGGPAAYIISEVASIAVPMTYLKFSRDAEREADLLGLEYDYAAGYDPHAFVEFFEKLNVDGKKKHSVLAKAFATHPMTADRIQAAQDEIRKYLPDRPEYLVDTSEFENVKARLIWLENGRRLGGAKGGDGNRPVLLRRTSTSSTDSSDSGSSSGQGNSTTAQKDDDGRPTLKRNPPDSN
jgi:Zn-dependent protease with chaperone function